MDFISNTLPSILQLVFALAFLIILHEIGHFVSARLMKIEIEEFGIGFPPRLATLFEAGGTKYTLNLLPLGGFVRPKGENDPEIPHSLAAASPWKRIIFFFAGPTMNLIAGVIIYAVIFMQIGMPILDQVQIFDVAPNSPAESVGLLSGDLIETINGIPVDSRDMLRENIYTNLGQEISITYERDGQIYEVFLIPRENPPENEGAIGISMTNPREPINALNALRMGGVAVYTQTIDLITIPGRIIRGTASPDEGRLLGYKGIFDLYQNVREVDTGSGIPAGINTLGFFGTITVSLGLLNLLPIPVLDGGRILFTIPEIIFKRRIPPAYENFINLIGFALLMIIVLYINLQDFINPIQLP